ncbi:MAG: pyridoxal-phosphate dependent enzyme [Actinomycetota bacterium]
MASRLSHLECSRCGRAHDADVVQQRCECGGTLLCRYDLGDISLDAMRQRERGTWRYRELLPVRGEPVSLGEHETALLFAPRLSERWGTEVYIKDEGTLPGSTFKARGACVALSRAVELGVKKIVMPTAGNAGGTWSLYAARAGVELTVVMAETAPATNQAEVRTAGAELVLVDGTIADAGRITLELARETGAFVGMTFSEPYRMEGKKAAWLEIFDRLGSPFVRASRGTAGRARPNEGVGSGTSMTLPRTIVLPVGGGVAAWAAAKAAQEVLELGWANGDAPALVGVQPSNCAPIVRAFERGDKEVEPWGRDPMTIAAGLRVPFPGEGTLVLKQIRNSGGAMLAVDEEDIKASMRDFAATEGVFACPEGATTLAAAERLARQGRLEGPVVLYNTGSAAKYTDVLLEG